MLGENHTSKRGEAVKETNRIAIKPLSVNQVWQGKRFKTKLYKAYAQHLTLLLPPRKLENIPQSITIVFGQSNPSADIDNPVKPFLDVLQSKYGIDDKWFYAMHVFKRIVEPGHEFIEFSIEAI